MCICGSCKRCKARERWRRIHGYVPPVPDALRSEDPLEEVAPAKPKAMSFREWALRSNVRFLEFLRSIEGKVDHCEFALELDGDGGGVSCGPEFEPGDGDFGVGVPANAALLRETEVCA